MNNKAFTLVELTAVLVVLVGIFLVCFPNLLNMTRVKNEKKYDNMVNDLCMAGKSYIYANQDNYESFLKSKTKIEIKIKDLMEYGNVKNDLKNPKTKKSVENDILIFEILSDNDLNCSYKEVK